MLTTCQQQVGGRFQAAVCSMNAIAGDCSLCLTDEYSRTCSRGKVSATGDIS